MNATITGLRTAPAVVGTVSQAKTLDFLAQYGSTECDWVEVRLDHFLDEVPQWATACGRVEERGLPVLLTLRHRSEGGAWTGSAAERKALYEEALPIVSAIDVEISSHEIAGLAGAAHAAGVLIIGSFHDFLGTPSEEALEGIVREGLAQGADIVKIATLISTADDEIRLTTLMGETSDPLAIVGMGPEGPRTRVSFPRAGSLLTYGFLDQGVAPGQVAARDLKRQLG